MNNIVKNNKDKGLRSILDKEETAYNAGIKIPVSEWREHYLIKGVDGTRIVRKYEIESVYIIEINGNRETVIAISKVYQ